MAKAKLNSLLKTINGSVDGLNVYQKGGATIISPQPCKPAKKRKPTEKELAGQQQMREANHYSKRTRHENPELYARYVAVSKKEGCLPFTVSNRDFNRPPVVDAIDCSAYRGSPGQVIRIRAHDDFEVRDLTVTIKSGTTVLEEGPALRQPDDTWHYISTATTAGRVMIEATARDWPDHKATKSNQVDLSEPLPAEDSVRARLIARIRSFAQRRGDYLRPDGRTVVNYFDKYRLAHSPALLRELAEQLVPRLPPRTDYLAGLEVGGIPLTTVLSQITGKPLIILRKKPREWGTRLPAEGGDLAGRHVLAVGDVVHTGSQLAAAIRALRSAGAIVTHAVCILDEQAGAPGLLQQHGVALTSLFTAFELIA